MPLPMNPLEKLYMLGLNAGPGPMIDVMGGFSFYAVSAAVRLRLFDEMESAPRSAGEIAAALNCDERGLTVLLEALISLGYVRRKNNSCGNTAMTSKWLTSKSRHDISDAFRYYHEAMMSLWPGLDESVRKGGPNIHFYEWLGGNPEAAQCYQRFMLHGAAMILPELTRALKLPKDCNSIVDIGGGHGAYAVAAARKKEDISVVIFDSDYSREVAENNIIEQGLTDRVRFVSGDYVADPIPGTFDAAFLFNVLHQHGEEEIALILEKVRRALTGGGRIFILDSFRRRKMAGLAGTFIRLYGLVHYHFLGGDNHHDDMIRRLLKDAGFGKIRDKTLLRSGMTLLWAEASPGERVLF